jgi:hypothetical protein
MSISHYKSNSSHTLERKAKYTKDLLLACGNLSALWQSHNKRKYEKFFEESGGSKWSVWYDLINFVEVVVVKID